MNAVVRRPGPCAVLLLAVLVGCVREKPADDEPAGGPAPLIPGPTPSPSSA